MVMTNLGDILKAADADARERAEGQAFCETALAYLRPCGKWVRREDLATATGLKVRELRLAGEYSGGALIFGQNGLKASECATRDELEACAAALDSQARKNKLRAADIRGYLHKGVTR